MIHHRIYPESKNLKREDYRLGFGLDNSLYGHIIEARIRYNKTHETQLPLREDFSDDYDLREGYNIEGKPFKTRYHEILGKRIKNTETNETYIIEGFYKHHYFGYYWHILIRREGTESHGTLYWDNINCKYDIIMESIKENKEKWIFIC